MPQPPVLLLQQAAKMKKLCDVGTMSLQDLSNQGTCICGHVEHGKMITCGNTDCDIGTYHYGCVGISRKPRGTWLCPDCHADADIDFFLTE